MMKVNFQDFEIFKKRVKDKWMTHARDLWWGDRLDSRFATLYYLKKWKNKRILDIGCNIGVAMSEIDNSNFKVGIDISNRALHIAQNLNGKSAFFLQADMFRLPFKDQSFDAVSFLAMLELVDHQSKKRCMQEINRVLKKGGELVVVTANNQYITLANMKNRLNYEILVELLEKNYNYDVCGFNPFPSFPFFLPNRILANIPFIWRILFFVMRKKFMIRNCRSFFAIAKKK